MLYLVKSTPFSVSVFVAILFLLLNALVFMILDVEDKWEQSQQKLLEMALQQYPKSTPERWDKIATCVPGKTKVLF